MTLSIPVEQISAVGVRPPVSSSELQDLVSGLSKADPRVPSNWSRRFKNHQEKLKSGDVYQVAEVVRNLAARNRDAAAPTFSPDGLYFMGPVYEDRFALPTGAPAYDWLP